MSNLLLGLGGQLGPDAGPVFTQILTPDLLGRGELQTDTVFRRRDAPVVANSPLADLCVALDVVAQLDHSGSQLRYRHGPRGR